MTNLDKYSTCSDEELVVMAQQGESQAYDMLIVRHSRKVHALVYQITANFEDAHDIAQDTFARAYRSLAGFNGDSAFFTWLHAIAINTARNHLKKRKNATKMFLSLDESDFGDKADRSMEMADDTEGGNPERRVYLNELQTRLKEAINMLSSKHREVVILHDVQGLTHLEISMLLGISEGTLRSRLHYAHKELKDLLEEYFE